MSDGLQILDKMGYQTYKIVKEQNEQLKTQKQENNQKIQKLKEKIEEFKSKNQDIINNFVKQEEETKILEKKIKLIKSEDDSKIFQLKNQLIKFQQRYIDQEKKNGISFTQQKFRQPNLYFCDMLKGKDGRNELKVVFHQNYVIKKVLTDIQQHSLKFIGYLEKDEVSHVIKHQIQLDSENDQIIQGNEITIKIG